MQDMNKELQWLLKEKYRGKPNTQFHKDVARLKEGEPIDYVIGFTEFLNCKINLSKKPLIPRPETEFWVQKAIGELKVIKLSSYKVLDIFAGSGCGGISIMRHIGHAKVTFADVDKNAILQIKINCHINVIDKKRYAIIQSDIFSKVKGKFDYVFANPPYIPVSRKNKIQRSVLDYEPSLALFGGQDGLLYIRKFLASAKNFLNENGKIYMEFDFVQKNQIEKIMKKYRYRKAEFFKDQYAKWRWVVIEN